MGRRGAWPPGPAVAPAAGAGVHAVGLKNGDSLHGEIEIQHCSAHPTEVIPAGPGRGVLGVVDGFSPKGAEDEGEIKWRDDSLRKIGYKL